MKSKIKKYGTDKELLKDRKQLLSDLESAKTQIEELMMTDISSFKVVLQKENQSNILKNTPVKGIDKKKSARILHSSNENNLISSKKNENENNIQDFDSNMTTKETLKYISSQTFLKSNLEKILKKNFNLAKWFFWLDITDLIEKERKEEKKFEIIQQINEKYLKETSNYQVLNFLFFKSLLINFNRYLSKVPSKQNYEIME